MPAPFHIAGEHALRMLANNCPPGDDRLAACAVLADSHLTWEFAHLLLQLTADGPVHQREVWMLVYDVL